MKPLLFIDGDQGTTGLQILSRLRGRHDVDLLLLATADRRDPRRRAEAINRCDIALLCLPDAAAREAVSFVSRQAVRIIDASSAHRVDTDWVYGLPELAPAQGERIAAARRVSNPGCYPTGALSLLRPLLDEGLLPRDYPVTIHAVSGYSGGGRDAIAAHEGGGSTAQPPLQVYGLGLDHKHVPEIQVQAGLTHPPVFVPAYGAFRQGIVLMIALHQRLLGAGLSAARVRECWRARYAGSPRVRVRAADEHPALTRLDPTALNGTDDLALSVHSDATGEQLLLAAVFDNLGKGAAGAALQNLSLMIGA